MFLLEDDFKGHGYTSINSLLGSARNAHILMYAAITARWPPRIAVVRSWHSPWSITNSRSEILRDSSIYLGDILICFQFFSLFQIVKEQNNSQYTIANILWIIVLYSRDYGGAKRDRTADLLRARQALSQLSYSPIMHSLIPFCFSGFFLIGTVPLSKNWANRSETRREVTKFTSVNEWFHNAVSIRFGRPEWTWTTDLTLIRGAL